MTKNNDIDFAGTERFEIKRRLGAGGMGVVYEAFDREQGRRVAIKTLPALNLRARLRFQDDFVALQALDHPNLVRMGEVFEEKGVFFFTMELVEGVDFIAYVSAAGSKALPYDEARLRAAIKQLAQGIAFLHVQNKVHRDIKPSNILVGEKGRVVLVDFGLMTHIGAVDKQTSLDEIAGSFLYMAPEQTLGDKIGPAADWYSMGVVLYQALTGRLPHTGKTTFELLSKKQKRTPPPPRQRDPGVPPDLDKLCVQLLKSDPDRRPTGRQILEILGGGEAGPAPRESAPADAGISQAVPFVGRQTELARLRLAYQDSRKGQIVSLVVLGESGMGKSELVQQFTRQVLAADKQVLIFSGRCYQNQSMPYRAFGGVADSLSRHLEGLAASALAPLLPTRIGLLQKLFPIMQRVRAIAEAPLIDQSALEPQQQRQQMFHAFRKLLVRLARKQPVILAIDDLQWLDPDSLTLLRELLHPIGAPHLFLLGTAQSQAEADLAKISLEEIRLLKLGELEQSQACELVARLSPQLPSDLAQTIASEAGGHPLYIYELVRHIEEQGLSESMGLDQALWSRISRLAPIPRQLIELLSVAGSPIAQKVAALAADLAYGDYEKNIKILRLGFLARTGRAGFTDTVEPYHNHVREAVAKNMDSAQLKHCHYQLATAMENSGAAATDPQAMVRHFSAAGENHRAAAHAEAAAAQASAMSAFDQAARFLKTALQLGDHEAPQKRALRLRLGQALVNAGRGPEAAEVFLAASAGADAATRLDCQRQAAEQLLISGHIESGLQATKRLLAVIGVKMPTTPRQAQASLLWHRARLRLRGFGWQEKQESQIAPAELTRLDVFKAVGHGLAVVDTIRGADFNARSLLHSLRAGERKRVARAFFQEAVYVGSNGGQRNLARAQALIQKGAQISASIDDPYLKAWKLVTEGSILYLNGIFRQAAEKLARGEAAFQGQSGVAWELSSARIFRMRALNYMGAFSNMAPLLSNYIRDAERRGDVFAQSTFLRSYSRMTLAMGSLYVTVNKTQTIQEMQPVEWVPPEGRYHLQHWFEFEARAEFALYEGWGATLLDEARVNGQGLQKSLLMRVQIVRVFFLSIQARLLLAAKTKYPGKMKSFHKISKLARRLEGEDAGYTRVLAFLLRAAVSVQKGRPEKARLQLEETVTLATDQHMHLHAAVAKLRLSKLLGGDAGAALATEASQWMALEGISNAADIAEMIAPGFD